ncbi:MAG: hypothetical protein AB7O66_16590 [Limisphaerales bacterium]
MTLDKDVERLLRDAMHRTRAGFKQTLNAAIRAGLSQKPAPTRARPFVLKARALHLRAGLDPAGFNKLADELEVAALTMENDAVLHTADADFARFQGLKWTNPLTESPATRSRRRRSL